MNAHALKILKSFGLDASRLQKPSDAMLAEVYMVEGRYILRSRPNEKDTPERFTAECELCDRVAELTDFRFPKYRQSRSGDRFVIDEDNFWTLHPIIPGHPMGRWFELHLIDPTVHREVLSIQRKLHTLTTGCFEEKRIDRKRLLELVTPPMDDAKDFLGAPALDRLGAAFDSVKKHCGSYPTDLGCFVHGDFHHGNLLAQNGRIVGFIDLDWCRVGSFYEDFAFSLMMMLRDYENWSCEFRRPLYDTILDAYGFTGDTALLNDHLILYALFDCTIFKSSSFDNAAAFFEYQKQFLEAICLSETA